MKHLPFSALVRDVSGGNAKVAQSEFLSSGDLPIVDQGKSFIAGYTDSSASGFKSSELPVIVFGDHTKAIKFIDFPFAMGADGIKVLKANKDCDSKYLYHYLRQVILPDAGYSRHYKFLKELFVPLPSLPEQRRIAGILDKADAVRSKRTDAIAKLDLLLKSVFFEMFGDPATNPKGLEMVRLGDLGEWSSGGTPSRSDADNFEGDIPWYTSGELNDVYVHKSAEHISSNALRASSAKLMAPGTLMLGMYDTAAFKSSISTISSACNQAIAFSKLCADKVETLYVYYLLQFGKEHYKRLQRGVRQKNLNLSMVRETRVLYPSMMQQQQFVRIAERVLKHKATLQAQAGQFDALLVALQQRAYNGTL
ncbi:restriction endonuclease subunit S [Stenotrophomonas sp. TWI819]|uniref:restriction endonuclease subunit S n=1 Tax=Stenotrophomonas sp. TWI819 TaxID=3136800 RepID=UPI00320A7B2A